MKQNTFCKALSNAVSFRIPGETQALTFNPCCLYNDYLPFFPPYFQKQRETFINAETFLPGCSKCELKEQTHGYSLRTTSNQNLPDGIGDTIHKLEIVLDTTCNAACIQCGTEQSSLWRNEIANRDKNYIHIQPESQIDSKVQQIKSSVDMSKVKQFHFWGGEPLLTDTHLKFLNDLEDPSEVEVSYTTNGSIFPDEDILELWSKFKSVKVAISIDGLDDKFHYIRWPLKWDKVARNLEKFKNNSPSNVYFHVNCCIIPLNSYYVDELDAWLKDNFSRAGNGSPVNFNFIRGEGTLDIACTPMSLRELIWKKLGDDHDISNVLREVPVIDPQYMLKHITHWDTIRKLDWKQVFPDIVSHFKL